MSAPMLYRLVVTFFPDFYRVYRANLFYRVLFFPTSDFNVVTKLRRLRSPYRTSKGAQQIYIGSKETPVTYYSTA